MHLLVAISNALGVSVPDLPVVAVAPEYMEQKATIDAVFALALGLYNDVNPVPTITGVPNLVKLLTQDCENATGGVLNVEKDPVKAVDAILVQIEEKRKKIGI
jgi:carbon-monoxide dehydrogenase catalytic subunit